MQYFCPNKLSRSGTKLFSRGEMRFGGRKLNGCIIILERLLVQQTSSPSNSLERTTLSLPKFQSFYQNIDFANSQLIIKVYFDHRQWVLEVSSNYSAYDMIVVTSPNSKSGELAWMGRASFAEVCIVDKQQLQMVTPRTP